MKSIRRVSSKQKLWISAILLFSSLLLFSNFQNLSKVWLYFSNGQLPSTSKILSSNERKVSLREAFLSFQSSLREFSNEVHRIIKKNNSNVDEKSLRDELQDISIQPLVDEFDILREAYSRNKEEISEVQFSISETANAIDYLDLHLLDSGPLSYDKLGLKELIYLLEKGLQNEEDIAKIQKFLNESFYRKTASQENAANISFEKRNISPVSPSDYGFLTVQESLSKKSLNSTLQNIADYPLSVTELLEEKIVSLEKRKTDLPAVDKPDPLNNLGRSAILMLLSFYLGWETSKSFERNNSPSNQRRQKAKPRNHKSHSNTSQSVKTDLTVSTSRKVNTQKNDDDMLLRIAQVDNKVSDIELKIAELSTYIQDYLSLENRKSQIEVDNLNRLSQNQIIENFPIEGFSHNTIPKAYSPVITISHPLEANVLKDYHSTSKEFLLKKYRFIVVGESKETISARRRDRNSNAKLQKDERGEFWIFNHSLLLPRLGLFIGENIYQSIDGIFTCENYSSSSRNFRILQAARVVEGKEKEKWYVREPGILRFK